MKQVIVAIALICALSVSASAQKALKGDVPISEVGNALEKSASRLGIPGFIALSKGCSGDVDYSCPYTLPGKMSLLAFADEENGPVERMMLIFGRGSTSDGLMFGIGAMLGMTDPDLPQSERGRILVQLLQVMKTKTTQEAASPNAIYSATLNELTGLWITAEAR